MVGMQPAGRSDQLLAAGVELGFGQPFWRRAGQRRDLRDRPPLQLRRFGVEPQLARDREEPGVELSIDAGCDLPDPELARDQIVGRRSNPAGNDQPRHEPPVMTPHRQLLIKCHRGETVRTDTQQERPRR